MIIVQLAGGLGNQMFQYSLGLYLSKSNSSALGLDIRSYGRDTKRRYLLNYFECEQALVSVADIRRLKYPFLGPSFFCYLLRASTWNTGLVLSRRVRERGLIYDPSVRSLPDNVLLQGFWQSEKYFYEVRSDLVHHFRLKGGLRDSSTSYRDHICSVESVAVHVRRGDYVCGSAESAVHGVCPLSYYRSAYELVMARLLKPVFFIFSDDLNWAAENLRFYDNAIFVNCGNSDVGACEELYLMSLCKHNIIANSTYSWWGAWLNQNLRKIVVAPRQWFNSPLYDSTDIIPASWIRL